MKHRVALISIWVLINTFSCAQQLPAQKGLPVANVHVEVSTAFGTAVRAATVRLFTADRKREVSDPEGRPTIAGVPYGHYIVVASDSGGGLAERELLVNAKDVWVRVGLAFPTGTRAWPGGDLTISGELIPPPDNVKDWWVRIEGVFLHVRRECPVLPAGRFSISGLQMGTYLVEVFEKGTLRHVETLDIDTNEPNTHLKISVLKTPK